MQLLNAKTEKIVEKDIHVKAINVLTNVLARIARRQIRYVNLEAVLQNLNALKIQIAPMDFRVSIKNALTNVLSLLLAHP